LATALLLVTRDSARASILHGETLDKVADVIAWVAIIVAPIILIVVFWLVHILPEKIAHKRGHPQTRAIQCLCLLSLVFAGLLWPLAWLWAYSKPVFYKMAYGTDVDESLLPKEKEKKGKGKQQDSKPAETQRVAASRTVSNPDSRDA
jgi:CBS domain containing-hemolysin-like protein